MVLTYKRYPNKVFTKRDNFYGSEQSRLHTYTKDRHVEEDNGDVQQAKVYQTLAESLGDIASADRLAKMGAMVLNKIGQTVQDREVKTTQPISEQPFDIHNYLKQAITNGTLSKVWEAIKSIPPTQVTPVARIVQGDIKNDQSMKDVVNQTIMKYAEEKRQTAEWKTKFGAVVNPNAIRYAAEKRQMNKEDLDAVINDIISAVSKGDASREEAVTELVEKASQKDIDESNAEVSEDLIKGKSSSNKWVAPGSVASSESDGAISYNTYATEYIDDEVKKTRLTQEQVIENIMNIVNGRVKNNWAQQLENYSKRKDFPFIMNNNRDIRDFILNYKIKPRAHKMPDIIVDLQKKYTLS